MAYVAVTGGQEAIAQSIRLLSEYRTQGDQDLHVEAVEEKLPLLIDKIMGEAGLYAPGYAALALKQSSGSVEEAVFLLRAYRSTLPRSYYSQPLDGAEMRLLRRISSAFKEIPGGQILGASYDYCHRLLDFSLLEESDDEWDVLDSVEEADEIRAGRVSGLLREQGLLSRETDPSEPVDVTQFPLVFPAPRSARLQTLARAESGYINGLAYASLRGFGGAHPTVGELRTGYLEVTVAHPLLEGQELHVGEILATEVESLFSMEDSQSTGDGQDDPLQRLQAGQGDKADQSTNPLAIAVGYGISFGRGDTKAISMSIMDYVLDCQGEGPLHDQEFVLMHGDCLEMSGFLSHLKLPHYVTFQSKLDRVRATRKTGGIPHE